MSVRSRSDVRADNWAAELERRGHTAHVFTAVLFVVLVMQAAFSAMVCHYIAAGREGVSTRRWTVLGLLTGPGAILFTWWFAGLKSGTSGAETWKRFLVQAGKPRS